MSLVVGAVGVVGVAQWTDPGTGAEVVALAPAVVAFVAWGLFPRLPSEVFAALVVAPTTAVVVPSGHVEGALFLNVLMVLYVSRHLVSSTRAATITAATAAVPWIAAAASGDKGGIFWSMWMLASGFTWLLGRSLHRQQRLIDELERARQALADQAVAEERRRIARELHDLAGHTLAAVLLHVTGARHVLRRDLDDAERALVDAETVGRASLDQIRATVASLRTDERGTDPALAVSADLVTLVDEYRRAGLVVDTTIVGPAGAVDGPVGTALHRIAREALANVARHARGNVVELWAGVVDGQARLVVADHGVPALPPEPGSGHFGLVGMRERARALGGRLVAAPTDDGWRVEARLPLASHRDDEVVGS